MTVIDRGILDEAYDTSAGWINATYVYHNFSLSASTLNVTEILDGLDIASGHNPEMGIFTDALRDNPALGETFRTQMIAQGGDLIDQVDTLLGSDTTLTTEQAVAFVQAQVAAAPDLTEAASAAMANETWSAAYRTVYELTHSPDDTLDRILAENPEAAGIVAIMRDDAELKQAFHDAIVNDGTFAPGMQSMLAGGQGEFTLSEFETMLQDSQTRRIVTDVLEAVANDHGELDVNFSHIRGIMEAQRAGDLQRTAALLNDIGVTPPGPDGMALGLQFLSDLFTHGAEYAVANMIQQGVELGVIDPEQAQMFAGIATMVAGPLQAITQPYVDIVRDHGGFAQIGRTIQSDIENLGARTLENGGITSVVDLAGTFPRAGAGLIDPEVVSANPRIPTGPDTAPVIPHQSVTAPAPAMQL